MHTRTRGVCGLIAAALTLSAAPAWAASAGLDAYRVKATPKNLEKLSKAGFDVGEGIDRKRDTIDVFGTERQVRGVKVGAQLVTDGQGQSAVDRSRGRGKSRVPGAADPTLGASDAGFKVWTKYDAFDEKAFNAANPTAAPLPVKEQYTEQYARVVAEHPGLVAKRVTGQTDNGREIVALQVTKNATGADIPGRPAVLYNSLQHAREWLAGETCRRTLDYMLDNYGKTTSSGLEVTKLVDENELWFVCVNNPDGYEFTFTPGHRLWRKNLRDNDANGVIEPGDGVDPNRNFSSNWGRDDEGSSPRPADETYRGPSPASEPETKAMEALFAEIHPTFQKNDHTAAELLLYPQGFQQDTPTADNEIFAALAGDPFKPAIEGFLPELSAGLYITNGDFTDWAYSTQKTLSYTPEGTAAESPDVSVFEYPDSPLQVGQEFRRHLPFVLDLAKSAKDPTEPVSHLGNGARKIVVDDFPVSYGDPQPVQATLQRKLGVAKLRFRVNGGAALEVPTSEFTGGERYYKNDAVYYHRVRGVISGTKPGDSVEAWFVAGGVESAHFTYAAQVETDNPVLLLSDEDWTGKNPGPATGPAYLDTYKGLLDAAGVKYDVYDVAKDRRRPNPFGILSHYSHVVWYTGDDQINRAPDAPAGSGIDRLAVDTQNDVSDFLNEGGKLFYTGQNAGKQFADGYSYNPFQKQEGQYCDTSTRCIAVQDDFLQYWLGANTYISDGGLDENGATLPVRGVAAPFGPGPYQLANSHTATFLVTSSIYDPVAYPQWAGSKKVLAYDRPGGSPFDPRTGQYFMAAGTANASYRRLTRTIDLTGKTAAELSFWTSYDLEQDYDYLFVEARTAGQQDWTTLKEKNGLNSQDTGSSCQVGTAAGSNWQQDHPFLAHYQTAGSTCTSNGTSGTWWAATGNSGGYKNWQLPLDAYAGKQVEISITVASDPAVSGLGTWIDDATVTANDGTKLVDTSFEEPTLGGFVAAPPPAGTKVTTPRWEQAKSAPFVEAPGVATEDTVYTGFGLEKIVGTDKQVALLKDVFTHLGVPRKPQFAADKPKPVGGEGNGGGNAGGNSNPNPGGGGGKPRAATPGQLKVLKLKLDDQLLRTARRKGVRAYAQCTVTCKVVLQLRVDRATAKRYRLKSIVVGRRTVTLTGARGKRLHVRMTATAVRRLAKAKRLRVTLRGTT
ncbi:MAG: immune inhibitor A, partial [Solirubrobacterales bacterium]|nr:immune inhibitor A [Solirubrobacterales bacterium]